MFLVFAVAPCSAVLTPWYQVQFRRSLCVYRARGYEELIAARSKAAGHSMRSFVMPWLTSKYIRMWTQPSREIG